MRIRRLTPLLIALLAGALLLSSCGRRQQPPVLEGEWTLAQGTLALEGRPVLERVPSLVALPEERGGEKGVFLQLTTSEGASGLCRWEGLAPAGADSLLALHRELPWWMVPAFAADATELPGDIQLLLWKRADGRYGLLLPLLDQGYRVSLAGDSSGLALLADNNLPRGEAGQVLNGAYLSLGTDPYAMLDEAFEVSTAKAGFGRLRRQKTPPRWVDRLGWCTWNAFYHGVAHDSVLAGLESLAVQGIRPGFLVLDDGWQQARQYGFFDAESWLTGLEENKSKFPQALAATVRVARERYGVEDFLVWMTLQGYWHGVARDSAQLRRYTLYDLEAGRSNRELNPQTAPWVPRPFGIVLPQQVEAFYDEYLGWMAAQGVTGVKVDNQSHLEFMSYGLAPRTEVMGEYRRALEAAVGRHFSAGSLINCMSLGSDVLFNARSSTVTRNSNDFFPDQPESHGTHLVNNAYNSLMTAQLVLPDWDMFQSGHELGEFHASARAISGGPVYIADKVGAGVPGGAGPDRRPGWPGVPRGRAGPAHPGHPLPQPLPGGGPAQGFQPQPGRGHPSAGGLELPLPGGRPVGDRG